MPKWSSADPPSLKVKPPHLFLGSLILGLLIHFLLFSWIILEEVLITTSIGILLIVIGFALIKWAFRTFKKHEIDKNFKAVTTLVKTGPFAHTRNPMYVSLILIYLGISSIFNSAIPILILPFTILFLYNHVIQKEETYLEKLFGKEYLDYKTKVRRWI